MSKVQSAIVKNAIAIAALDHTIETSGREALQAFAAEFGACDVPTWKAKRTEWVNAYNAARGSQSGDKRFSEVVRSAGVQRPQSAKAAKVQAKRKAEAAKAPAKVDGRTKAAREASAVAEATKAVKSGAGAAQAKTVRMELSAMEAHLIGLIRAAKFTQAAQCVADMAAAK